MNHVNVFGAGLAGCEAAWQIAERGIAVTLYEMKPHKMSPAHHSKGYAELVCSNSLRSDRITNAVGLLKEELSRMGGHLAAHHGFRLDFPRTVLYGRCGRCAGEGQV